MRTDARHQAFDHKPSHPAPFVNSETGMNERERERFRQKLLGLKTELRDIEESAKGSTQPAELDQASIGRLSRMDALQAQHMAQEAARRRQRQLSKIDGALRRIESGDYGNCFICGC